MPQHITLQGIDIALRGAGHPRSSQRADGSFTQGYVLRRIIGMLTVWHRLPSHRGREAKEPVVQDGLFSQQDAPLENASDRQTHGTLQESALASYGATLLALGLTVIQVQPPDPFLYVGGDELIRDAEDLLAYLLTRWRYAVREHGDWTGYAWGYRDTAAFLWHATDRAGSLPDLRAHVQRQMGFLTVAKFV